MPFLPRRRLTASRLDRARHCLWWAHPTSPWAPEPPGPAAERGSAIHAAVAQLIEGAAEPADGAMRAIATAASESIASYRGLRMVEIAVAWDTAACTARVLEQRDARDYSQARDTDVIGTADLVVTVGAGAAVAGTIVRDWKTGSYTAGKRPRDSEQMRMLALAAARIAGAPLVRVELAQLVEDGETPPRWKVVADRLEEADHQATATWLAEICHLVAAPAPPAPVAGSHCRWCPSAAGCPAVVAHARRSA